MADISKVAVQSGIYTIKDIQARSETNRIDENLHQEIANIKSDITTINEDIKDIEEHIKSSGVSSINGEQGDVIITAEKVSAAPIGHVSKEANDTDLGHVRIDETYKAISAPTNSPVVASARALQEAYQELKNHSLPPHASTSTEYGVGTTNKYGHVKISNTYNTPNPENVDGVAASAYSVQSAYNELNDKIEQIEVGTGVQSVNGKNGFNQGDEGGNVTLTAEDVNAAPINHASNAPDFGGGTDSLYGHVILSDEYNYGVQPHIDETGASTSTAASLYAVQKAYYDLMQSIIELSSSISGEANQIGFDNTKSNLTYIDEITGEEVSVANVQDAIDVIVEQKGPIEVNPILNPDEEYLDLTSIKIGPFKYSFVAPREIDIGKIKPVDENVQIHIDTTRSYGNAFNLMHIEDSEEGF